MCIFVADYTATHRKDSILNRSWQVQWVIMAWHCVVWHVVMCYLKCTSHWPTLWVATGTNLFAVLIYEHNGLLNHGR